MGYGRLQGKAEGHSESNRLDHPTVVWPLLERGTHALGYGYHAMGCVLSTSVSTKQRIPGWQFKMCGGVSRTPRTLASWSGVFDIRPGTSEAVPHVSLRTPAKWGTSLGRTSSENDRGS